jgi:hypothetical protein
MGLRGVFLQSLSKRATMSMRSQSGAVAERWGAPAKTMRLGGASIRCLTRAGIPFPMCAAGAFVGAELRKLFQDSGGR